MVIRSRGMQAATLTIYADSSPIMQVSSHRHLGVIFNETLGWSDHVTSISLRASQRVGMLRRIKSRTSPLVVRELYQHTVLPVIEYASVVWSGLLATDAKRLERCNRSAARVITGISPDDDIPREIVLARAGLDSLCTRRKVAQVRFAWQLLQGKQPQHLLDTMSHWLQAQTDKSSTRKSLRDQLHVRLPLPKKNVLKLSPLYLSFSAWNSLPETIRSSPSHIAVSSFFARNL